MPRRARGATGALLESAWQAQLVGLARFYGWVEYHTHDSRGSARGFPDLVLRRVEYEGRVIGMTSGVIHPVERGRVVSAELLFVEVKPDKSTRAWVTQTVADLRPEWLRHRDLRQEQADWLEAIRDIEEMVAAAVDAANYAPRVALEAHVWRPRDWDAIQERLARGRVNQRFPAPS